MTRIDIISGFLGAGKTTLINRLIHEAYKGEKIVLIENEFGEIGIDGGFLKDAGIEISEMNSGCICCSLVGDFSEALKKVVEEYSPDRILIEPSGVGKLSDVTKAVLAAELENAEINSSVAVVDVNKCKMYMKNFGEFFGDQIENAGCVLFSHTDKTTDAKLEEALALVREKNADAVIITTPADKLSIDSLISALEQKSTLKAHVDALIEEDACPICGHHHDHHEHHHDHDEEHEHEHHHHDHDEDCDCGCHEHHHHHDHDEECEHHHHHHHDHDEEHEHHHHEHGEECDCGCHGHHHDHDHHGHHHHHADDVFTSWGRETVKKFSKQEISDILEALADSDKYGMILRAKGMVECPCGKWIYFDYVPGEPDVREGSPEAIGKLCVIGSKINEDAISALFGVK
ncbi:MAG: GTP-binding protein [Clostridia bacterium]|nr:GTP-binding protein [Clostridia bacterium]